ncbi:lipoprotein N-acyltransferase Lnb domain-containing protein [Seonamhaeicola aphaedonensis]|uniref:Uncharacterized protein DUF4105 n=1 Tax=Seonamhaeicola aphaedonensis TaxID=1461338 RepID=A0A3D9HFY4_9FLAO|nr:DUF4105 domain-containing protein [Seonamhaeicola aphaedonensis]RED48345.1 uncharacterized protein DUF4105 [Seonamhaeicola aphaedonensis]
MTKKLLLFLLTLSSFVYGQQLTLSNTSEISVLTVGPGTSLNDAFGHSAFRIKDPNYGLDVVYGYGEYDFDAPNFYLKFAQGKLNYLMGKDSFSRFYQIYIYFNRTIKEQVLNLSQSEKQKLYDYLITNYKPENRAYLYEFFFDNCATKIKDVVKIATDTPIAFNSPEGFETKTFRNLIYDNVDKNTWGSLGIDVALGSVIDREATPEEHMFLPENIYKFFEVATKNDRSRLVKKNNVIFTKRPIKTSNSFFKSPLCILGIISFFILFLTYKDFKKNKRTIWLDVFLFSFTGIIGILILFLWFATDHTGTHHNYNLLWAFALNILMIGQLSKKTPQKWFTKYVKFLIIMLCLMTLHWIIGVQVFAIALIPLLIALGIRYLFLLKHYSDSQ